MTSRTRLIGILVSAPVIAFTVIGGLLASMVLSLIVTPAVHYFLSAK